MAAWTNDELDKVGTADELRISSLRRDDTLRKPVRIWVVRLGDDLYVRAVKGREGPWFRGTQTRHEGHIKSGGVDKDVTFVDADPDLNDAIDEAYQSKYGHYPYGVVKTVVTPQARAATIRLVPR